MAKNTNSPDSPTSWNNNDHDTLIRVEAKLDNLMTALQAKQTLQDKTMAEHEQRILIIERFVGNAQQTQKVLIFVVGAIGGFVGFLVAIVSNVSKLVTK